MCGSCASHAAADLRIAEAWPGLDGHRVCDTTLPSGVAECFDLLLLQDGGVLEVRTILVLQLPPSTAAVHRRDNGTTQRNLVFLFVTL